MTREGEIIFRSVAVGESLTKISRLVAIRRPAGTKVLSK